MGDFTDRHTATKVDVNHWATEIRVRGIAERFAEEGFDTLGKLADRYCAVTVAVAAAGGDDELVCRADNVGDRIAGCVVLGIPAQRRLPIRCGRT